MTAELSHQPPVVSGVKPNGVSPLPRKPGRPKGIKNRRTLLGSQYLNTLNFRAKRRLRQLIDGGDDELALKAATLVLAYSFGKPIEVREVSGPGGGPIETRDVDDREFARLVAYTLTLGDRQPVLEAPVVDA